MANNFVSITRLQTFLTSLKTWLSNNYVPTYRRINGIKLEGDIILEADDVGALPDTTTIPTKTSQLSNDSNYITKATALSTTVTLGTSWSGSSAPYTQTVTVSGLLATDTPILDVVTSTSNYENQETAWSKVFKAVSSANTLTFYAKEKTETSLSIQVKVVR